MKRYLILVLLLIAPINNQILPMENQPDEFDSPVKWDTELHYKPNTSIAKHEQKAEEFKKEIYALADKIMVAYLDLIFSYLDICKQTQEDDAPLLTDLIKITLIPETNKLFLKTTHDLHLGHEIVATEEEQKRLDTLKGKLKNALPEQHNIIHNIIVKYRNLFVIQEPTIELKLKLYSDFENFELIEVQETEFQTLLNQSKNLGK